jgi:hypothetical protein
VGATHVLPGITLEATLRGRRSELGKGDSPSSVGVVADPPP